MSVTIPVCIPGVSSPEGAFQPRSVFSGCGCFTAAMLVAFTVGVCVGIWIGGEA